MAAKFEFLYRRGMIKRPTRKDYNREKKKYTKHEVEAKRAEMAEQLRQTYATSLEDFCEFAQCELAEFEMFCSLFAKMAFILGVGKKTADQPQGRFAANFGFFIQP